jgi:hypothetical protein
MEDLLHHVHRRTSVPWLKCILTVVLVFIGCLGVVTIMSDTGFSDEITKHRKLVYAACVFIALTAGSIYYTISSGRALRRRIADLENLIRDLTSSLAIEKEKNAASKIEASQLKIELDKANNIIYSLIQDRIGSIEFEIQMARYDGDALYISVKKHKGIKLTGGHTLAVVHKDDNKFMGYFEVAQERIEEYYARGVSNIDPVWAGYIKQEGELSLMPHLAAIYIPNGETDVKQAAKAE